MENWTLEEIYSETNIGFIKNIYKTVVKERCKMYEKRLANTEMTEQVTPYWRDALKLYYSLNKKQKKKLMDMIEVVITDTISLTFGILDGCSSLSYKEDSVFGEYGEFLDVVLKINGISTEDTLLDAFWAYVEEIEQTNETKN